MLASLIANNQNVQPGPQPRKPTIKIDRGGAGPSWPGYDIVDIMGALRSFHEVPGEHPVARAARRHHHIGDYLKGTKQRQEEAANREAAAFMAGAALAQSAAEDTIKIKDDEIANWISAYDKLQAEMAAQAAAAQAQTRIVATGRGAYRTKANANGGMGIGAVLIGITAGVAIGFVIARRTSRATNERVRT